MIDGSLLLPKCFSIKISTRFLYYFSVYVNLSKNSCLVACEEVFLVSGCKGTTFFRTTKTFAGKISQNMHFFYWS